MRLQLCFGTESQSTDSQFLLSLSSARLLCFFPLQISFLFSVVPLSVTCFRSDWEEISLPNSCGKKPTLGPGEDGGNHLVETLQLYLQLCMEESGVRSAGMWQITHYAVTSEMALLSWRLGHLHRPLSLSLDLIISYAKPS